MEPRQEIITAVQSGDLARVQALVAADPALAAARSDGGASALLTAIYYGQPAIAAFLIGALPALDIFEAAAAGRTEPAAALLAADPARINAYAADGFTSLGLAAFFGHLATVELLLARGADPNAAARNASRVSPLHSALAANDPASRQAVAAALVAHGADVNARQEGGYTPLHAVAFNGDLDLARLLLAHGADPSLANDDGLTPSALALKQGFPAIADLLQK